MALRLQIQESRTKPCQTYGTDPKRSWCWTKSVLLVVGVELKSRSHVLEISVHGLKRVKPSVAMGGNSS